MVNSPFFLRVTYRKKIHFSNVYLQMALFEGSTGLRMVPGMNFPRHFHPMFWIEA
jgi:hypothetical protein